MRSRAAGVAKLAAGATRAWSEARQPRSWKAAWRRSRAVTRSWYDPMARSAADSSRSRQAFQAAGSSTAMALSGRKLGAITGSPGWRAAA